MSRTVSIMFSDAMYCALVEQATADGGAMTTPHIAPVVRKAVKVYLQRTGHSSEELIMTDKEFEEWRKKPCS